MKKWIALLLALVMVLSLCACGGKDANGSEEDTTPTEQVETTSGSDLQPHTDGDANTSTDSNLQPNSETVVTSDSNLQPNGGN